MAKDTDIDQRLDRLREIIDQLDADECSLDDGERLYEEGHQLLNEIRELLQNGDGDIVEIE